MEPPTPNFTCEHYGACAGGHAATVVTTGDHKKEDVIAFVEKKTQLFGYWNIHHLTHRADGVAWVCQRVIPTEVRRGKRVRY